MSASPALLDTLASYVPARIVRRIANDPALPTTPIAEQFEAAVFFADISGFTQMAERLGQSGPSGTEELRRLINVYFDQLIALIAGHGGDIIKFAGDALFAIWPTGPDGEALPTVTLRAAQCALDTQKRLNNYPAAEDWKLFLRIGVEAGDVLAAHVGGERGRWEYLLTGEPVVQVGLAEHQRGAGHPPQQRQEVHGHLPLLPLLLRVQTRQGEQGNRRQRERNRAEGSQAMRAAQGAPQPLEHGDHRQAEQSDPKNREEDPRRREPAESVLAPQRANQE